ncbi:hypothetical protein [Psychroserpens sp. S379A]|uniref:hypothetical protein n=1 Tax=Psychroserpens sp. S379A TaxID=3415137 RepID=UPI003C7B7F1C
MKLYLNYILVLFTCLFFQTNEKTSSPNNIQIALLTSNKVYTAGDHITLEFASASISKPLLFCSGSYGSTILEPELNNKILKYTLPDVLSKKAGNINWILTLEDFSLKGNLKINPIKKAAKIENYLGPPSVVAGGTDFSMLVSIPTDLYDNPLDEQTPVTTKQQFLETIQTDSLLVRHQIAYQNIYSLPKSGKILVASECFGLNSKEYTIVVQPAIPTNFRLKAQRIHHYADGNQITTFTTSIITDKHDNVVSDGTFVQFYIKTGQTQILQTSGLTINGVAQAQMIHPEFESNWKVKAYVEGISESNSIQLTFKQAVEDFDVTFSETSRLVTVGPLKSFMNQMIPDGMKVQLKVFDQTDKLFKSFKTTVDGIVTFNLKDAEIPKGQYNFEIESAGIIKSFKDVSVW